MVAVPISTVGGVSVGYGGTIDEQSWALNASRFDKHYGVIGDAWRVTPVIAGDRTVNIAAGTGYGAGVADKTTGDAQLQLPSVASGSRYDLIVARRNWAGAGGTTEFDRIAATSGGDIPVARARTPGVLDEQPLAIVQVIAGQTVPVIIADLRVWQENITIAQSAKALQYLDYEGACVRIGTDVWTRTVSPSGIASWTNRPDFKTDAWVRTWGGGAGVYLPQLAMLTGTTTVSTDGNGDFSWNLAGEFGATIHYAGLTAAGIDPVSFSVTNAAISNYTFRATIDGVPLRNTTFPVQALLVGW